MCAETSSVALWVGDENQRYKDQSEMIALDLVGDIGHSGGIQETILQKPQEMMAG